MRNVRWRISKDSRCNGHKKKDKKRNNNLQNSAQETKDKTICEMKSEINTPFSSVSPVEIKSEDTR